MVNDARPTAGPYADAAARWFAAHAGPAGLRRLIAGGAAEERRLALDFRGFGLRDLLRDEPDAGERAALVAQVAREAGRALYAGPLIEAGVAAWFGVGGADDDATIDACASLLAPGIDPGTRALHVPHAAAAGRWWLVHGDGGEAVVAEVPATLRAGARIAPLADGSSEAMLDAPFTGGPGDARSATGRTRPGHDDALAWRAVDPRRAGEWRELAWLATAARLVGSAEAVNALARDHLGTRRQFGRTLASFQVLQHQAVDRHCDAVIARALLDRTLAHWDDAALRAPALHALKARAAAVALASGRQAVQHCGAMGFSHDGDAGLHLRHALVLAARHGDERHHRAGFARVGVDFLA